MMPGRGKLKSATRCCHDPLREAANSFRIVLVNPISRGRTFKRHMTERDE